MKHKKIVLIIALCLVIMIIAGIISVALIRKVKNDPDCISRQEWIGMLGEYIGTTEYSEETSYFEDVDESNEYFAFIQSAVEWDYIEADRKFHGDRKALGEFIAVTAMKSVGEYKIGLYLGTDEKLTDDDYLDLALEMSLIEKGQLKDGLSEDEADEVLEKLDELYYGEFWPKNFEETEYQDDVKELADVTVSSYDRKTNTVKTTKKLQKGDIISFNHGGFVIIGKVAKVAADGVYELDTPEMEEVFKTLKQSGVAELTFQDIVNYYGKENLIVAQADDDMSPAAVRVSHIFGGKVEHKGYKIEVEEDDKKLKIYITDHETGTRYQMTVSPELADGFENFAADIDISRIFVGTQIDFSALSGLRYAEVAIDIETSAEVGLATEDEISDRIMLFETLIPLGNGVVGVDVQVYLVITFGGEVYLKADIPFQADVYYEKGKGIRNIKPDLSIKNPEVRATAEIKKKIDFASILVVGGLSPVIDAEIGAGISGKVTVEVHDNGQICTDGGIRYPVVDISVGQSDVLYHGKKTWLAGAGLSASWDNIFEGKRFYKVHAYHHEILPDGKKQFVEECTYGKEPEYNALDVDFSEFAGTYKATEWTNDGYGGGQALDDLHLDEQGIVTGGGSYFYPDPYPPKKPVSVEMAEDGAYKCVVDEETNEFGNIFYIYPAGIVEERFMDDELLVNSVYIRYVQIDGGVSDAVFYKVETVESTKDRNIYTTKDKSMPEMAMDYPGI